MSEGQTYSDCWRGDPGCHCLLDNWMCDEPEPEVETEPSSPVTEGTAQIEGTGDGGQPEPETESTADFHQIRAYQVLAAIEYCSGVKVSAFLRDLWGVGKSQVHREMCLVKDDKLATNAKVEVSTPGKGTKLVPGHALLPAGEVILRKNAAWAAALGILDGMPPSWSDEENPGGASEGTSLLFPSATETEANRDGGRSPELVEPVPPEASLLDKPRGIPRARMEQWLRGYDCTADNIRQQAEVLTPPEEVPPSWKNLEFTPHRQGKKGGVHWDRTYSCDTVCGCQGKGWLAQLWWVKGEAAHLDVSHWGKMGGTSVPDLCYGVESRAKELMERSSEELGIQLKYPGPLTYHLEVRDEVAFEALKPHIPYGHSVSVQSGSMGMKYSINQSGWGRQKALDMQYEGFEGWRKQALAGDVAEVAMQNSRDTMDKYEEMRKEMDAQGSLLRGVITNMDLTTEIVHKRQLSQTVKRLTEND